MRTRLLPAGALALLIVGGVAAFAALGVAAPNQVAAQAQYAPTNTAAPTISDTTPQEGQELTANPGTWSGDQPIVYAYQWQRCNASGANCVAIPNADDQRYTAQAADRGNALRVAVTATNSSGSRAATSAATSAVAQAAPRPPAGTTQVAVANVNPPDRLIIDQVRFTPNPVRSSTAPITIRARVLDTQGRAVSGAVVFARTTPLVTTEPDEATTDATGWATVTVRPERDFRIVFRRGYNLQWFVRARKPGDNPLAGISGRRLVQVRISPS